MREMVLLTSLFTLLFSFKVYANPELIEHNRLIHLAPTEATCNKEALVLREKLQTFGGLQETHVTCLAEVNLPEGNELFTIYSLHISFKVSAHFNYYVADFKTDIAQLPIGGGYPAYPSYGACLKELAFHKQTFQAHTGLNVLLASCEETGFGRSSTYAPRLEGFGIARERLLYTDVGVDPKTDPTFYADVLRLLTIRGLEIAKNFGRVVFYYAPERVTIKQLLPLYFDNSSECWAQQSEAEQILKNSGVEQVISRCLGRGKTARLMVLGTAVHGFYSNPYYFEGRTYYSYEECRADIARIIATSPRRTLGALCSANTAVYGRYIANLYYGK